MLRRLLVFVGLPLAGLTLFVFFPDSRESGRDDRLSPPVAQANPGGDSTLRVPRLAEHAPTALDDGFDSRAPDAESFDVFAGASSQASELQAGEYTVVDVQIANERLSAASQAAGMASWRAGDVMTDTAENREILKASGVEFSSLITQKDGEGSAKRQLIMIPQDKFPEVYELKAHYEHVLHKSGEFERRKQRADVLLRRLVREREAAGDIPGASSGSGQ